jgi:hypothetical protein
MTHISRNPNLKDEEEVERRGESKKEQEEVEEE